MESEATMIDEARRASTVLEFHLAEARKLVERMESVEDIAVEQAPRSSSPAAGGGARSSRTSSSATC